VDQAEVVVAAEQLEQVAVVAPVDLLEHLALLVQVVAVAAVERVQFPVAHQTMLQNLVTLQH
jgi:hypothetical protein